MRKLVLVAISAAALLVFPGTGRSALVPVELDLDLDHPPGWAIPSIVREGLGDPLGRADRPPILDSSWTKRKNAKAFRGETFAAASTLPLRVDAYAASGDAATPAVTMRRQDGPSKHVIPVQTNLLGAGKMVLEVSTVEARQPSPSGSTPPAVPLPGALWLFGTALVAFVGIAGRHKL
ncbi:MAG TPA: hypothetical protein VLK85_01270 [Ramlibacter sp.]|nr:hypothetical protein [Ramlibacter sp.]